MKKCKILFIISMALMLFFVTFGRNKVYANKINNLETSDYDANLDIEFDDSIEELKKLLLYYQKELSIANDNEKDQINSKIAKLEELIEFFDDTQENINNEEVYEKTSTKNLLYFGISPDCICDQDNYLLMIACPYCKLYYDTLKDVASIIAGFSIRGWKLAADLMLHNLINKQLDSYYTPSESLVNRLAQSPQILEEISVIDNLTGCSEQSSPGRLSGLFENTLEGDVYNALGSFNYAKSYVDDENVNITILDRYDWAVKGKGIEKKLLEKLVLAQEIKVVVPFYTKINFTTSGSASLGWHYNENGVVITKFSNKIHNVVIPTSFLDLRVKSTKLPSVSAKSIADSAFENCQNLQNITLPNYLTDIGNSAFKGCTNLASINIPNLITSINSNTFENCISLKSVLLHNNITSIGVSAFKGCTSLESINLPSSINNIGDEAFKGCTNLASINIPNSITSINSNTFENCQSLKSVLLHNNIISIGASAFKGCTSLESINLPSSINNIGDEAFKNCSSLTSVTVNREISNTTNLGENAFDGCHTNLQIIVPTNRIAEYKNKEYWSSYRNKIIPSEDYTEYEIDCEGSLNYTLTLNSKYNKLYKLNVDCSKSYKINANSLNNVNIIIYDSNMNVVSNDSNTITQFLGCGTYYISFEFNNINDSGIIEISITLTWLSTNIPLSSGINNIKNSMHLNSGNIYHCSYEYLHNQGEGFYRFSLNFGNNRILPEGAKKIYSDRNRTTLVSRYTISGINKQAVSDNGENEIYLYLPGNSYYYIDIVLPKSTYTLITLTIEEVENKDINYLNRLDSSGFDVIFEDKTSTSYFEKITISHRSKIELNILTSGTINRNIPICIFEIQEAPGSRPGDEYSYIVSRLTDSITSINRSPVFTIILNPGTYYIGYSDNFDKVQIQFALRRKVNTDLNIDGTLVTDPARNQGFPLGSEVTFNNGALLGNTITEGFTRNIYLMVEDRVNDPMSRLDYDWYSSNENVAKVTKYGTVLALNVNENTTVTIYAINKDDPSIVYKKDFVILKETKTEQLVIECNMTYSYSEENGMYTLELDFTNCPYPYIGYYVWDIESFNGISVDMEHYGLIYSTGPGEALLTANYILNMRIFLKIHLTITE